MAIGLVVASAHLGEEGDEVAARGVRRRGYLAMAVLGAIIWANAFQFPGIDRNMPTFAQGWYAYDSPDLLKAGMSEDPNARSRYDVYVALSRIAPDSVILIPSVGAADAYRPEARFYGLGQAAEVAQIDLDATGLWAQAVDAGTVAAIGPGGGRGAPWRIIIDPEAGGFEVSEDPRLFVRRALANEDHEPGPARVWLWLKLPQRDGESPYLYQNLLVEASLVGVDYAAQVAP